MIEPITPGGFDMTYRDKRRLEQIRKLQRDNDRRRAEKFKDMLKKEMDKENENG